MSFYKEVPGRQTTLESTLKFDTEPKAGSTNPVTSDGVKSAIDGAVGDASAVLQNQIDDIAEKAGSGYTPKGEASVDTLNGLSGQENGELYTMTDAGTLTDGSLAVVAGDTVAWDATNEVWYKAMDYAPRQYGTNEVHNLPTTITAFRTGDYIAVDGTDTAKMSKDDLLRVTAENALGSIHSINDTATEADLVAGNYLALDGSTGTKKLPANIIPSCKLIDRGSASVTTINGLSFKQDGWKYFVTNSGTLSAGSLDVVQGDYVFWDATNSVWKKLNQNFMKAKPLNDTGVTTLNDLKSVGIWYCTSSYASSVSNIPFSTQSFFVSVYSNPTNILFYQTIWTLLGCIYTRYYSSGVWTEWECKQQSYIAGQLNVSTIAGGTLKFYDQVLRMATKKRSGSFDESDFVNVKIDDVILKKYLFSLGNSNISDLNSIENAGIFYVNGTDLNIVQNIPPDAPRNLNAFLFSWQAYNGVIKFQRYEVINGDVFTRYSLNNSWQNWVKSEPYTKDSLKTGTRYCACGDSITAGFYRTSSSVNGYATKTYPEWIAELNNYTSFINTGKSGSGWQTPALPSQSDQYNAMEKIDSITWTDYDITTLSWGTNDWGNNKELGSIATSTAGDTTIVGAMKYCIEKIYTENPNIKVIVIGPCNRSDHGSKSVNWSLNINNSATTPYTLQELIDTMKEVCKYYGVQFIDQSEGGLINRENVSSVMYDGVHPKYAEYYEQIGKSLSKKIEFA